MYEDFFRAIGMRRKPAKYFDVFKDIQQVNINPNIEEKHWDNILPEELKFEDH